MTDQEYAELTAAHEELDQAEYEAAVDAKNAQGPVLTNDHAWTCRDAACPQAVVLYTPPIGAPAWYITMHHPNFNGARNNAGGYPTEQKARRAIRMVPG